MFNELVVNNSLQQMMVQTDMSRMMDFGVSTKKITLRECKVGENGRIFWETIGFCFLTNNGRRCLVSLASEMMEHVVWDEATRASVCNCMCWFRVGVRLCDDRPVQSLP